MLKEEDIRLARFLLAKGSLDKTRLEKFQRTMGGTEPKNCIDVLIDTLGVNEDVVSTAISEEFNIPFVQLSDAIISLTDKQLKDDFLKKFNALPIIRGGIELTVAFTSPPYKDVVENMRKDTKAFIIPVVVKKSAFLSVINQGESKNPSEYQQLQSKFQLESLDLHSRPKEKVYEIYHAGRMPNADVMIDEIMIRAVKSGASDVYFEPMETEFRVRFNIDGVLSHVVSLPKEVTESLCNVMRTRGSLNMFEKKKAQDGRYTAQYGNFSFDLRVHTLPTVEGERFSIRILKKSTQIISIEDLGLSDTNLVLVRYLLNRPRGILMIAGASGGGKSTTVYGILNELRDSQKNIITVENPVEYRLEFASQVQVDPEQKLDYASSMRAVLKQLPDLIFLGEIQNAEAGAAAAEAALTGTMVISTILSSDALSAIPRMMNYGIPPAWLAPTLNGIIYQQIVRRVCKHCKESYKPTEQQLASAGLSQLGEAIVLYRGHGCDVCGGDGHLGRTAIHEVLVVDEELKDLIYNQASPVKLKETAARKGFESIRFDAAKKLMAGIISLDEYLRVLG
ncbi:MAG: GspE/PulE family protein [Bacteroidota bacterium]|nr:GspE/PulE family protein [Bacteroidota bacterium]